METFEQNILVPIDFSDKAAYGVSMAANLIKNHGGNLTVVNILKGVDPIWSEFFTDEEREHLLNKIELSIKGFIGKHAPGFENQCQIIIEKGKFCDTLMDTAEKIRATMIVMGTSTVNNIKKWIIGSNALRVVSEANCPVITLKDFPTDKPIKRIILPLDLTKESREKVVTAVQLAKLYNAEIFVVSAQTINDEAVRKKLQNQLIQVKHYIENHKIKFTGELISSEDRAESILKYIEEKEGDLIIITTHQQLEVVKAFMGTFAKEIIKESNIPVMSIVPKLKHQLISRMPGTA